MRKEFWGYAADEALDNEALIDEKYRGIRPAPGYPACPEHSEKATLFALLDAERNAGMHADRELRDVPGRGGVRLLLQPPAAASTSWSAACRRSRSRTTRKRKGVSLAQAERWLASNLDYDPE